MKTVTDEKIEDHLAPPDRAADGPAYRTWKEAKIRKAQKQAEDRGGMTPAKEVWEELGLEH